MGAFSLGIAEHGQCFFHSLNPGLTLISGVIDHTGNYLSRQNSENIMIDSAQRMERGVR